MEIPGELEGEIEWTLEVSMNLLCVIYSEGATEEMTWIVKMVMAMAAHGLEGLHVPDIEVSMPYAILIIT